MHTRTQGKSSNLIGAWARPTCWSWRVSGRGRGVAAIPVGTQTLVADVLGNTQPREHCCCWRLRSWLITEILSRHIKKKQLYGSTSVSPPSQASQWWWFARALPSFSVFISNNNNTYYVHTHTSSPFLEIKVVSHHLFHLLTSSFHLTHQGCLSEYVYIIYKLILISYKIFCGMSTA